jgi:hypothetical protein
MSAQRTRPLLDRVFDQEPGAADDGAGILARLADQRYPMVGRLFGVLLNMLFLLYENVILNRSVK